MRYGEAVILTHNRDHFNGKLIAIQTHFISQQHQQVSYFYILEFGLYYTETKRFGTDTEIEKKTHSFVSVSSKAFTQNM